MLVTKQVNGENEFYMFENIANVRDELFDNAPPAKLSVSLPNGNKTFYYKILNLKLFIRITTKHNKCFPYSHCIILINFFQYLKH